MRGIRKKQILHVMPKVKGEKELNASTPGALWIVADGEVSWTDNRLVCLVRQGKKRMGAILPLLDTSIAETPFTFIAEAAMPVALIGHARQLEQIVPLCNRWIEA